MTEAAEQALAQAFDGEQAILFGRARSAHLALFEALGLHGRSCILIPSNACPSLLACAWASGAEVRLAPVSAETGVNTDAALAKQLRALSRPGRTGAVLLTHLYGFRLDFSETRKAAKELGWVTIENDANASSFAPRAKLEDAARIVSFGPGKVLDVGSGGAVITRNAKLAEELRSIVAHYPALDDWAERDDDTLMLERRALRNAGRSAEIEATLVAELRQLRFGFAPEAEEPLLHALAHLPTRLAERQERREMWIDALSGLEPGLQVVDLDQTAPWRLIIKADPHFRDPVVSALRKAGIDAGTNYPALTQSFPTLTGQDQHPDADAWSRSALNLWLDARYDGARINTARTVIESELEALT